MKAKTLIFSAFRNLNLFKKIRLYTNINYYDLEKLEELASPQNQLKDIPLQDKLGKQNFHEVMKKVLEPFTDTVKQTAQEVIGAVKDTTKAIEENGEETNNAINEIEELIKYAINFDLRLLEPIRKIANSKNTSQLQLQVNLIAEKFLKKNYAPRVPWKIIDFHWWEYKVWFRMWFFRYDD